MEPSSRIIKKYAIILGGFHDRGINRINWRKKI